MFLPIKYLMHVDVAKSSSELQEVEHTTFFLQ